MHSLILGAVFLTPQFTATQELDGALDKLRRDKQTPGVSIVVSRNGEILYAKGFGVENLKTQKPMAPGSVHELASVSKQFTAAAILLLQQDGKLSIEDKLSKYFPSNNKNWDGITLRHVLNHTAGLPDYLDEVKVEKEYSRDQLVDSIREHLLDFVPGTKWSYSNSGYMLLGFVVEKVSRVSLADFLAKRIYKPAGMSNALANDPSSKRVAVGYSKKDGKVVQQGVTSLSLSQTGDGQTMCSAIDLARWDAALWSGKILSERSRELMFSPGPVLPNASNPKQAYGMGMGLVERDGRRFAAHGGGWMGTSTHVLRDLRSGAYVVVLCNADFDDCGPYVEILLKKFAP